jgi:glutamine synthetase
MAAGLDGINKKLKLEPAFEGNAYISESARVPSTMQEALALWSESPWIREVFGAQVQDHYANMAKVELGAFNRSVTDWERFRNFERF